MLCTSTRSSRARSAALRDRHIIDSHRSPSKTRGSTGLNLGVPSRRVVTTSNTPGATSRSRVTRPRRAASASKSDHRIMRSSRRHTEIDRRPPLIYCEPSRARHHGHVPTPHLLDALRSEVQYRTPPRTVLVPPAGEHRANSSLLSKPLCAWCSGARRVQRFGGGAAGPSVGPGPGVAHPKSRFGVWSWPRWNEESSLPALPGAATVGGVAAMRATAISWLIALGPTDGAQSVAGICIYVPPIGRCGPGSNGPGSEKPSIDSTFA
jgi:hypothetical protein